MIGDMLRQNWSTLHSHSIDLKFRHSAKEGPAKPAKGQGADEGAWMQKRGMGTGENRAKPWRVGCTKGRAATYCSRLMSFTRMKSSAVTLLAGARFGLIRVEEPEIRIVVTSLSAFFTIAITAPNMSEITTTAYITLS